MALNKNKEKESPEEELIKGAALTDEELAQVSGGDMPCGEPTIKVSGWNTKEKVTVQKQKSADKSADDVKLT